MRKYGALAMLFAATTLLATTAARRDDTELAKVNGESVTVQDLLDAFTARHGGHARFLGGNNEARAFLKILIEQRLLVQEAYDIGLDRDPTVVKATNEFARSKASEALVRNEIDAKAKPADDEIHDAWKSLNFVVQAREIAVDSESEAQEIRTAIMHGADFETLARSCSMAQSRVNGGHVIVNWGQADPDWERVVFALQPGEVSPVFETAGGYQVVVVDDRKDVTRPPFDKMKSGIEAVIVRRKLEQRKKDFSDVLWQKYHVALKLTDDSPAAIQHLSSDAVVATWDGGGSLVVSDVINERELQMYAMFPPNRARKEIEARIRATVNDPLATLEAAARHIESSPEIANEVQQYRETMMESALLRDHIFRDLAVTDDDVAKYYAAHNEQFTEPEQRRVAQILVVTEDEAQKVYAELMSGADFAEMAKKVSRDFESAGSAGELGWITAAKVPPSFSQVLTLSEGSIAKPVHSANGWHIIKVVEIRSKRLPPIDDVRESVRKKALEEKQLAAQTFWLQKLRAAAKVEINDAAIKRFVAAYQWKGQAPPQHGIQ